MALMPSSEDCWLTRPEVGERLRVPEKTLAQWASQKKGPRYYRFGRHCRYLLSDVIAWEQAQFSGGSSPPEPERVQVGGSTAPKHHPAEVRAPRPGGSAA